MDALEQLNLAAPLVSTYAEVEETILCHIAEQLAANPDTLINAASEWRIKMLAQMGRVNKDTARIIASKVGKIPSEVQQVVQSSIDKVLSEHGLEMNGRIEESTAAALKNYDLQAVKDKYNQVNTVMQYKAKQAYVKSINSVADKLLRKEQEVLKNSREYLDILNKNAMATVLGEKSRTEAIRETIAEMSKKGIPAFVDKTGREWSPEAYVDMDIRNTAKNAALAAEFASLDELGQDIVLISSHSGARPLCAPYQGKLYSISGKSGTITDAKGKTYTYTPLSETSFGEAAGLLGINCGHRMRGVSEGTFINREKEFDGEETSEEYRKVQRQRALEREVRKKKTEANMLEAAGDKDAARDLRRLALDDDRKLKAYCEKEGLSSRRDRTEVYGYSNKVVDKSKESGIIKANEYISHRSKIMKNSTLNVDNLNENDIINTGAISGAKKTAGWQDRHAEKMYEEIRHRTTDIKRISEYTSFSEKAVQEIKQHMFFKEHKFEDGTIHRFDPDFDQVQAWDRLSQGKGSNIDIEMLKHEYVELTQMRIHGYAYEKAHEIANKHHNWWELAEKEK